jgi:hypothetical protein
MKTAYPANGRELIMAVKASLAFIQDADDHMEH